MFPSCFYNSSFDWFWGELASWPQRRYLLQRRRWQSRWGKIYHLKKTKKRKFFIFQNSKTVFRYERTSPHFATSHDFHMFIGIFFEAFLRRVGVPSIGSTSMCQATDKVKWLELGITRELWRRSLTIFMEILWTNLGWEFLTSRRTSVEFSLFITVPLRPPGTGRSRLLQPVQLANVLHWLSNLQVKTNILYSLYFLIFRMNIYEYQYTKFK